MTITNLDNLDQTDALNVFIHSHLRRSLSFEPDITFKLSTKGNVWRVAASDKTGKLAQCAIPVLKQGALATLTEIKRMLDTIIAKVK